MQVIVVQRGDVLGTQIRICVDGQPPVDKARAPIIARLRKSQPAALEGPPSGRVDAIVPDTVIDLSTLAAGLGR